MADYIYLLENRLSAAQQAALLAVRQVARAKGLTVFLVGGAVRDMTSGSPVRDLDVVVQGNALKLKKEIEKPVGKSPERMKPFRWYLRSFLMGFGWQLAARCQSVIRNRASPWSSRRRF